MSEILNIPAHWEFKTFENVCEIINGKRQYDVEMPTGKYPIYGSAGPIGFTDEFICEAGTTIIGRKGTINTPIYVTTRFWNIDTAFGLSPKDNTDSKYLFYFCVSYNFAKLDKSTTIPSLAKRDLLKIKIPLPPLSEQRAIVAKIEELLSDLENGKQQLLKAQEQLKVYRQSLLKAAFEGKLTGQNCDSCDFDDLYDSQNTASSSDNHINHMNLSLNHSADTLPEGWKWVKLGDVCKKIGDIDHKMPKQLSTGYPYVSTKDFTDDLKISFDSVKYISKDDYINLSEKIKPEKGDIIFPRYGTIGKNILVDFDKEFLVSYSCAVIKPNNDIVISKYVYYYSLSPRITKEIKKYTVETTQANVGIASIKNFVFPLPSLSKQQLIVEELERKLTVCDKIEETITQSLAQAETLKQSILKKAFEGKLI